jgi:DNA-binding protein HU-beta
MMNLSKEKQAELLKQELDISKTMALDFLSAFERIITDALANGQRVKINDIGVISVTDVPGRTYRNPSTGGEVYKDAHRKVKFKPSQELTAAVN